MAFAVVAATFAQLLDLATFARMVVVHGPDAEANPLVAALLVDHGLQFVAVTKIAVLSFVVGVIAVLASREGARGHRRLALTVATIAVVAGVLGGWSNVVAIV